MRGADHIVNAASYTGSDALEAVLVKHEGTRNLLEVTARCTVPGFVQLSTTSAWDRTTPWRDGGLTSLSA